MSLPNNRLICNSLEFIKLFGYCWLSLKKSESHFNSNFRFTVFKYFEWCYKIILLSIPLNVIRAGSESGVKFNLKCTKIDNCRY